MPQLAEFRGGQPGDGRSKLGSHSSHTGSASRGGPTIRRRILVFWLIVSFPLLALSIGGVWMYHQANQNAAEERLVAQAHAMALLLDSRFVEAQQLLRALTASPTLARGDLGGFLQELRAVAAAGDAEAVSLAGPDGQVLLSTMWPSTIPPRAITGTQHALDALTSGRWSISNLFVSPTTEQHAISVVVPFDLEAPEMSGRHLVAFILKRKRVLDALASQRLPTGGVAAILDRHKVMVARTLRDRETVGTAGGTKLEGVTEDGAVSFITWEGVPVVSAHAHAPLSGYWVRVHVPKTVFQAPLRAALLKAAGIGAVLLATSLALAILLARQIAASLRFLAPGHGAMAAREMGIGLQAGSGLREVDDLVAALDRASAQRDSALAELQMLHASSPVGMAHTDTGGRIQAANDAFLRLVGLSASDLGAGTVHWDSLTPPEWQARDEAAIAEAVDWGYCRPYEKEFVRPDGERVPVLVAFGLLDRSTGKCATFAVDLTDRKRAEAAEMASAAMLRSIMDATADCVKVLDSEGRFLFANAVACENLGVRETAELAGRSWFDLWESGQATTAGMAVAEALAGREARFQGPVRNVQGKVVWWNAIVLPIPKVGGKQDRVLVVSRDGTADRVMEQAQADARVELEALVVERTRALSDTAAELVAEMRRREVAQAALEQSQKLEALGQLTGSVAHDFNNVLAAVQGSYRLIKRRVTDPKVLELIEHGNHAVGRATKLIGQLLAFARREELQPALTDLAETLRIAEDMICHVAGQNISCTLDVGPDTWPVLVDPVRLETVLLNLTANARDAMPDGGVITLITRNARADELPPGATAWRDHVVIALTDSGIGMDTETLQRATEPFFTTKPSGEGTGLGLASAHAFALQSGGAIVLASAPGEGTTISLFLPRADVIPAGSRSDDATDLSSVLDPARHGNATLLVVEDDAAVRAVTAGMLRDLGYRVIEAPSAESAEALVYLDGHVNMVVTDVVMGGVQGPTLVGRLRVERPGLPALYITGRASSPEDDGVPVLRKPFTEAALARAVLNGLGRLADDERNTEVVAARVDRLRERLRRPELREAYLGWLALRDGRSGTVPATGAFPFESLSKNASSSAYLAEALEDGSGSFRFVRAGLALEQRLGRPLVGMIVGGGQGEMDGALGGSISAVYRRCVSTRAPSYDYARFALGDGRAVLLERLILPLSADGAAITHLAGVAVFSELEAPDEDDLN